MIDPTGCHMRTEDLHDWMLHGWREIYTAPLRATLARKRRAYLCGWVRNDHIYLPNISAMTIHAVVVFLRDSDADIAVALSIAGAKARSGGRWELWPPFRAP